MADIKQNHYDEDPVVRSDDGKGLRFGDIVRSRMSRRDVLKAGAAAGVATTGLIPVLAKAATAPEFQLDFIPLKPTDVDAVVVAENYSSQVVVRWGDAFRGSMADFDVAKMDAKYQQNSFGYNCDYVGYFPLPYGSKNSGHGLLAVNNEYVNPELMFPIEKEADMTKAQADVCLEAVGMSVVEVRLSDGVWEYIYDSKYNKRHTATSLMEVTGPGRGSNRMKTVAHPDGEHCVGTMANCAAGRTPWGTVLSGEENFQGMFRNAKMLTGKKEIRSAKRYGLGQEASEYVFDKFYDRFDCAKDTMQANTFGWVAEVDPYDPSWTPRKRTSLGRCRHEAATTHVTKDGKVVMYTGDDARFEYVYKFVSFGRYDANDRAANRDLLDRGILYVAKYNDDGTGEWLPLIHGYGPLTNENGFDDQADVVIDSRIAADLLGATKMDRPEDIEVNPFNQKVYVVCTNNVDRGLEGKAGTDKANPRSENKHGHIIEMTEEGDDHAANSFTWNLFLVAGDPNDEGTYFAGYPKDKVTRISCPDNICFDAAGNLWIATDGAEKAMKIRDGFYAVPTEGPDRGYLRQFMATVTGSEVCGPEFTPDGTTAFLAIQHPGEGSKFAAPSTRWPDGEGVPRPSVIAIRANNGGVIGSLGADKSVDRRDAISGLFRGLAGKDQG